MFGRVKKTVMLSRHLTAYRSWSVELKHMHELLDVMLHELFNQLGGVEKTAVLCRHLADSRTLKIESASTHCVIDEDGIVTLQMQISRTTKYLWTFMIYRARKSKEAQRIRWLSQLS